VWEPIGESDKASQGARGAPWDPSSNLLVSVKCRGIARQWNGWSLASSEANEGALVSVELLHTNHGSKHTYNVLYRVVLHYMRLSPS
jgi:hypothetical protein